MAYVLTVNTGKIVIIANSLSEMDKKATEAGFAWYEIEETFDIVIL